jgi:hypothetical protein
MCAMAASVAQLELPFSNNLAFAELDAYKNTNLTAVVTMTKFTLSLTAQ